jgi:intracellular multiplication protein IcmL
MVSIDPLALIFKRNSFYRRQYLLVLVAIGLAVLAIFTLLFVWFYIVKYPQSAFYFAVDNTGHLLEDVSIKEQYLTEADVFAWTIKAIESANSFDYINYRAQLENARKYFNDYGWINYKKSLDAANNLTAIIQRKMISTARVVDRPKILKVGILYDAYTWKLEMPLLVTYWLPPYDDKNKFSNSLQVTVVVQRQPVLQSYQGLSILQLIETSAAVSNQPQEISNVPIG